MCVNRERREMSWWDCGVVQWIISNERDYSLKITLIAGHCFFKVFLANSEWIPNRVRKWTFFVFYRWGMGWDSASKITLLQIISSAKCYCDILNEFQTFQPLCRTVDRLDFVWSLPFLKKKSYFHGFTLYSTITISCYLMQFKQNDWLFPKLFK